MRKIVCILWLLCSVCGAQVNTDYVLWRGQQALGVDDYLGAIRCFTAAIEARPFQALPYYYRAYAKFTLEDYHGAAEDCTRSIDRNPYLSEVYQLRGLCRIHLSDYAGAASDYTVVLRDDPRNQGCRFNRALCYYEDKRYDEADADLLYLLHRTPSFYRAQLVRAQILMERGDTVSAMAQVDAVLGKTSREASAWSMKGRYALMHDEYVTADTCLTHALDLQPKDFDNYLARAAARHALNRFDAAIADYDSVLVLVPEHYIAHYNRGLLRSFVGDLNNALLDFDYILSVEPDNLLATYNRAELRLQTGDWQGAVDDYSRMLAEYPDFLYGYQQRAVAYRRLGKNRAAVADETRLARADLDLMYGKNKPKPRGERQVRKRSEHELDDYQLLIDSEPEQDERRGGKYTRLYGKVQNVAALGVQQPVAPFALYAAVAEESDTLASLPVARGFMPEADRPIRLYTAACTADTTLCARLIAEQKHTLCLATDGEALLPAREIAPHCTDSLLILMQQAAEAIEGELHSTEGKLSDAAARLALQLTMRAQLLAPKNAYLLYNTAYLLAALGERDDAIKHYSRAIDQDGGLAAAFYNRALLYADDGKHDAARADFSRAGELGFYPAYAAAKKLPKEK